MESFVPPPSLLYTGAKLYGRPTDSSGVVGLPNGVTLHGALVDGRLDGPVTATLPNRATATLQYEAGSTCGPTELVWNDGLSHSQRRWPYARAPDHSLQAERPPSPGGEARIAPRLDPILHVPGGPGSGQPPQTC